MREQVVGLFQVESGPHEAAAMLGAVGYVPSDLILASTLWKIGAIFGGLLGAIVGSKRGLEPRLVRRYEEHIARGALALAARVHHRHAPQARAIFIESGAFDVRNVEGTFVARKRTGASRGLSHGVYGAADSPS